MVFKKFGYQRRINLHLLIPLLSYFIILFAPAYVKLVREDALFGNDVSQYILTAKCWIEGKCNMFVYPYPVTPLLYVIPSLIIKDLIHLYVFGCFLSIFITAGATCAMFYLLSKYRGDLFACFIGAMIFGTFPLLLDIIGWGGQSTLLATFFGIITLSLLQRYKRDLRIETLILISITLLLSSLTEPYISLHFIIASGVALLMETRKFKFSLKSLIKKAIFLLPPLMVVFVFVNVLEGVNITLFSIIALYIMRDFSIINKLVSRLTFNDVIMALGIFSSIIIYSILRALVKEMVGKEDTSILISSTIASLILFLITPSQYADRALFLISVPLALMVTDIVYSIIHSKNSRIVKICMCCLMFVLLLPGRGVGVYVDALSFYYVDKDLLAHILRLRQDDGNLLYISPMPWAFSLAYVSGKEVFPTTQPVWFTRRPQIDAAILAFLSALGVRWIDAGEVKVVDASPLWAQPAPAICVAKYPYFVELFRLSDGVLPIAFSPITNESIVWYESPFYAKEKEFWNTDSTMFSMYKWDTLTIVKSVHVDKDGVVNIAFNYSFVNSFSREIRIRLISLMLKEVKVYTLFTNDAYAQIRLIQSFEEPWYRQFYDTLVEFYVQTPGIKQVVKFIESDEWGLPEVVFTLTPTTQVNTISILIKVRVADVKLEPPRIVLRNISLRDSGIRFVIINKFVHPDALQIFQNDPEFEKIDEFSHYVIYVLKDRSTLTGNLNYTSNH